MKQASVNHADFLEQVFPAELEEISRRRSELHNCPQKMLEGPPSVDKDLTGLAISGGGIRSATFSMGVVQELSRYRMLRSVDYLSTVSGGGYTGSCISSVLNEPLDETQKKELPSNRSVDDREPRGLVHLRNSSNYLTPGGFLDKLRLGNVLLRGVLLNIFIYMPYILLAVFLTEMAYEYFPHWNHFTHLILPFTVLFLVLMVAFPLLLRFGRRIFVWSKRNSFEKFLTIPPLIVILVVLFSPVLFLTRLAIEHDTGQAAEFLTGIMHVLGWKTLMFVLLAVFLLLLLGQFSAFLSRLTKTVIIYFLGLLGPIFIFIIYLALCLWQIDSPYLDTSAESVLNEALSCTEPCLVQNAGNSHEAQDSGISSLSDLVHLLLHPSREIDSPRSLIDALKGRSIELSENAVVRCQKGDCLKSFGDDQWQKDNRVWVINDAPELEADCPDLDTLKKSEDAGVVGNCHYISRASIHNFRIAGDQLGLFESTQDRIFLFALVGFIVLNFFLLDMNITSLNGFYRDRLSKAYLFRIKPGGEIAHNDSVKLSELHARGGSAPYHLINATLNLQASKDVNLRGRKSDFFIFSKRYIGCEHTGYAPTEEIEKFDHNLDLGTAMAISGAAAAPNMGATTNRSLVFILTLLNVRLGYWVPNPALVKQKRWNRWFLFNGAKPSLLWHEALGKLDKNGTHVNVSDGGHIENMGIYPLLKRRCKLIICIDGEADPEMTFNGLVKLTRFARIDMGITFDMDLDPLRPDEHGFTRSHWIKGRIIYSNGETAEFVYIKLSMVGDEPEYIRAYKAAHSQFPHESTADQFFSENQFEAYRALGEHACSDMLNNCR